MRYAYIENGVVTMVESRTDLPKYKDDPDPLSHFYHEYFRVNFVPIPEELTHSVQQGWFYSDKNGFSEGIAGDINVITKEVILPKSIPVTDFYTQKESVEIVHQRLSEMQQTQDMAIAEVVSLIADTMTMASLSQDESDGSESV